MAYRSFERFWQASTPATIRRLLKPHHPFSGIALPAGADTFHRDQQGTRDDPDTEREGAPGSLKDGVALDEFGLRAGYSGTGYTDFDGSGDDGDEQITWTFNVADAGAYALHIRYASTGEASDPRPLDILVEDQTQVSEQEFVGSGFANWEVQTVQLELAQGDNSVTLAVPSGQSNGPNIDAVALTSVGADADAEFFPAEGNTAPVFDDPVTTASVVEGVTAVHDFGATDADNDDSVSYGVSGADADAFAIDGGGALSFDPAPDFEAPNDTDGVNVYDVTVEATDGIATTTQDVTVTVTDIDDEPVAGVTLSPIAVDENTAGAVVADIAVADPDTSYAAADLTLGGADMDDFDIVDGTSGPQLKLKDGVVLDFEASSQPDVTVTAGGVTSAALVPSINDVAEGGPTAVSFLAADLSSYDPSQDQPGDGGDGASVSSDGTSLTLSGNLWKRLDLPADYTVTPDTKLAVDVSVGTEVPEIVAIGIDADDDAFNGNGSVYQLGGRSRRAPSSTPPIRAARRTAACSGSSSTSARRMPARPSARSSSSPTTTTAISAKRPSPMSSCWKRRPTAAAPRRGSSAAALPISPSQKTGRSRSICPSRRTTATRSPTAIRSPTRTARTSPAISASRCRAACSPAI